MRFSLFFLFFFKRGKNRYTFKLRANVWVDMDVSTEQVGGGATPTPENAQRHRFLSPQNIESYSFVNFFSVENDWLGVCEPGRNADYVRNFGIRFRPKFYNSGPIK